MGIATMASPAEHGEIIGRSIVLANIEKNGTSITSGRGPNSDSMLWSFDREIVNIVTPVALADVLCHENPEEVAADIIFGAVESGYATARQLAKNLMDLMGVYDV